jgi:hypothetical protein
LVPDHHNDADVHGRGIDVRGDLEVCGDDMRATGVQSRSVVVRHSLLH